MTRVAPDGSRVYFVASGDLLSEAEQETLESEGRPVPLWARITCMCMTMRLPGRWRLSVISARAGQSQKLGELGCAGRRALPDGSREGGAGTNDSYLWLGHGRGADGRRGWRVSGVRDLRAADARERHGHREGRVPV